MRVATHDGPSQATSCRVAQDKGHLYFAFECQEDKIGSLASDAEGRDHPRSWQDDCVHLFIAPGKPRELYYHIIVTVANAVFDERVTDAGQDRDGTWNADIRSATQVRKGKWQCEIAVPLSQLSPGRPPIDDWRLNVARAEQPHREWSSWALLNASLHEFSNFGVLSWGGDPVVKDLELPAPFLGRNEFRVAMGTAGTSYVAELQVIRGDSLHPKTAVRIAANAGASFTYTIEEEGKGAVRLIIRPEAGHELLYASPPVAFEVPPVLGVTQRAVNRLTAAVAATQGAGASATRRKIARRIGAIKKQAETIVQQAEKARRTPRANRQRWAELYDRALALGPEIRIAELQGHLAGLGFETMPSFGLGTESSLRKLAPDDYKWSVSRTLALQCARRERESGQLVVASLGDKVQGVAVEWTGLRGPADARIPHDCVEISRVGYVTTRRPVYVVQRVGAWPDPLMPIGPFDIPQGTIQPLWVTVSVPADAAPGDYVGEIRVSSKDEAVQTVALRVQVWDVELPLHGKFRTGFGSVFRGDIRRWYGFPGEPPEDFRRKFYDLLLKNRINPAGLYVQELWPLRDDIEWCHERGMNAISLGNLGTADAQRLRDIVTDAAWLRQRRLLDMAYVYGFSCLCEEDFSRAQEAFSKVRRFIPGLERACPVQPVRQLWGYVNTWSTLTAEYDHIAAQKRRRLGEEVWWYVCCGPRHPYANFFIDYPATDARTLFWNAYRYDVKGFFYYEVAMWATNMLTADIGDPSVVIHEDPTARAALAAGKRWPEVPWNTFTFSRYNGDGLLVYPGRNETPLPSLRLEIIRDGIEDYELLAVLEGLADQLQGLDQEGEYAFLVDEAKALTSVSPQVARDLTHFTDDPSVINAERERIANQAVRLKRVIAQLQAGGTE